MRILILGVTGMLGHKLYQLLPQTHEVIGTIRGGRSEIERYRIFRNENIIEDVDAFDFCSVKRTIDCVRPNVVINCIGIIKQIQEANNYRSAISINALFPHLAAEYTAMKGIRFIQISTDCVFSGKKGGYIEEDVSDALDLYGRTKHLGEVISDNALTIRTSIIGRELTRSVSLLDWFISQKGKRVSGYTHAIYSGLTTNVLARELNRVIVDYPDLHGLYHVSSDPISKFALLEIINRIFCLDIALEPQDSFVCDRSLNSLRYRTETMFQPASWEEMIKELSEDKTQYSY